MSLPLALMTLCLTASTSALPHSKKDAKIEWNRCPEEFWEEIPTQGPKNMECAKFPVPLDYTDENSDILELDIFRVAATKEPVKGTVFFNPGGPGGPGGENLPSQGPILVEQFGGHYNVVSWDPRGTGKTIPFNCSSSESEGLSKTRKRHENNGSLITVNSTEYYLNGGYEEQFELVEACYEQNKDTGEFIGTVANARDVMLMVDALCEDGLLRYYGLSYGTVLGNYLAAMFPDRVERMILDANANPHQYQDGSYETAMSDAEKTLVKFFDQCLLNADRCSLAQYTKANSTKDIIDALNVVIEPLAKNATKSSEAFAAIEKLKADLHPGLYFPDTWPSIADDLTAILNGTAAEKVEEADGDDESGPTQYNEGPDAINGIRCGDSLTRVSSPEEYVDTIEAQRAGAPSFGDIIYRHTWACSIWKFKAKEQYTGDFHAKTKHPILFINGLYDPACPMDAAFNASSGYEGSVVLTHGGYGHGVMVHPSQCTNKVIQEYLSEGTLPEEGKFCEADEPNAWELSPWLEQLD